MSRWRRGEQGGEGAPLPPMPIAERELAGALGLDDARVLQGHLDGRDPLTTVLLVGRVPDGRRNGVARAAASRVRSRWPESARMLDVYLRADPVSDPYFFTYGPEDGTTAPAPDAPTC